MPPDHVVHVAEAELAEMLGRLLTATAVMAVEDQHRVPRQLLDLGGDGGVDQARAGDARGRVLFGRAHVEEVEALARVEQLLQRRDLQLLHRRGRVRIVDREIVAGLRLDVVDLDAVGAPRARQVEVEGDAVALARDLAGLVRAEIGARLEARVDARGAATRRRARPRPSGTPRRDR